MSGGNEHDGEWATNQTCRNQALLNTLLFQVRFLPITCSPALLSPTLVACSCISWLYSLPLCYSHTFIALINHNISIANVFFFLFAPIAVVSSPKNTMSRLTCVLASRFLPLFMYILVSFDTTFISDSRIIHLSFQ